MNGKKIFVSKNTKGIIFKENGFMIYSKFKLESTNQYRQDFPNLERSIVLETLKNLRNIQKELDDMIKEYQKLNIELNQTKLNF